MINGLDIRGLIVRYGGLIALDGLDLEIPRGRLTGLIGPNGAGKTTAFNACSGLVEPAGGTISLFGDDITKLDPPARARRGLGRTFQRPELFDRMTVAENIALAREATLAGGRRLGTIWCTRAERDDIDRSAQAAIELCGLDSIREQRAATLSTGHRRLTELARALASGFLIFLLDEPSAGLDATETAQFGEILRTVIRERDTGILLVEHDMTLVRAVCDYIYVLDFGRLVEHGPTAQVMASAKVQAAYLGTDVA